MRVVRGARGDVERDAAVTRRLADHVADTGEPALRVWTPPRQVAFGRRDRVADGYEPAREAALERGYEPVERRVGGHAVAYTGETVAFAYAVPTDDVRGGIAARYEDATDRLLSACRAVGATVERGEPPSAFCPGDHSLQHSGKLAGIAQRVRRDVAVVGGCVVAVAVDESTIATVLDPVYSGLDVSFDLATVGSVESAGGPNSADALLEAIQDAFVDGQEATVSDASALLE